MCWVKGDHVSPHSATTLLSCLPVCDTNTVLCDRSDKQFGGESKFMPCDGNGNKKKRKSQINQENGKTCLLPPLSLFVTKTIFFFIKKILGGGEVCKVGSSM